MPMINRYYRGPKVGVGQHGEVYLLDLMLPSSPGELPKYIPVAIKAVKRVSPKERKYQALRHKTGLPPRSSGHLPVVDRLETTEQKHQTLWSLFRKEIAIMKKLRHPHVVRLFEVIDDSLKDKIYMVMEFLAGGEVIWRYDDNTPRLAVAQSRRIIRDAVLGLEYCIIHRDIKPANLLWTADRTQVKIADFGVSHFSYAQRLAAAGAQAAGECKEPILMNERDLTKLAGTPSFVAPEVVWDFGLMSPLDSQMSFQSGAQSPVSEEKPKVTKAIDIWGLGVTLYCLLFGRVPFAVHTGNEFDLYRLILTQDWHVDEYMGSDHVATGGRGPDRGTAVDLLERFLQKDYRDRITLQGVKSHPWVIEDLPDPRRWLEATAPVPQIRVTADETDDAMSVVRFKWSSNPKTIATRLTGFFSKLRTPVARPLAIPEVPDEHHDPPGASAPNPRSTKPQGRHRGPGSARPGGRTAPSASSIPYVASRPGLFAPRSEVVYMSGKDKGKKKQESRDSAWGSPVSKRQRSGNGSDYSGPSSVATSPVVGKPRWKFLPRILKFQKPSTPEGSNRALNQRGTDSENHQVHNARRSVEQVNQSRQQSDSGLLTAAHRAASWGQGDEPLEFAEVMSITSSEWMLNDHDFVVGAGGVETRRAVPKGAGIAPRTYRPKFRDRPEASYIPGYLNGDDEDTSTPRRRSLDEDYWDGASSVISGYGEGGQTSWTDSLGEDEVWDEDVDHEGEEGPLHMHPFNLRDPQDWNAERDGPKRPRSQALPEVIPLRPGHVALGLNSDEDVDHEDEEGPLHIHPFNLRDSQDWNAERDGPKRPRSQALPGVIPLRPGHVALGLNSDEEDDDDDEEDDDPWGGGGVVFAPRARPLRDDELSGLPFGSGS
ncbi:other/CAMKK/ELM protein kinase [Coprinopsis sp. MPI-PUGE-AT-0042]|nr:other/CAMKK/ELM protein kinase [Coprinopsis sp. MPI-PUGE-AT-0042]